MLVPMYLRHCGSIYRQQGENETNKETSTPLHHNWTVPLVNQTQQFLSYGQPVLKSHVGVEASETLVAIWIGINDIGDSDDYDVSFPDFYDSIVSAVFSQSVTPLYEAGYYNFLFVNLPPLDRTPGNVLKTEPSPNKAMIGWWDDALEKYSTGFAAEHKEVKTMLFDANTFLNGVLDDASEYGIMNTTGYCAGYLQADVLTNWEQYGCPVPLDQYFWFNTGHM